MESVETVTPQLVLRMEFQGEEVWRVELPASTKRADFVFSEPCEVYTGVHIQMPVISEITFHETQTTTPAVKEVH